MATDYVLDTNIVLHYTRTNSDVATQVEADYALLASPFRPVVCAVTIGEMLAFAKGFDPARQARMEVILAEFLVIDLDREEVLGAYADLHKYSRGGVNIEQNDLWVAAVANALDSVVVTTDKDLLRLPRGSVKVIQVNAKTGATENTWV